MRAVHTLLLTVLVAALTAIPAASVQADSGSGEPAPSLQPFLATYDAWNGGRPAGTATMRLAQEEGHWLLGLDVTGNRGLARWVRLDIDQDTVFDVVGDHYRPLRQSTRRKALFVDRKVDGIYDWEAGSARWEGDIKAARRQPVALREGDMGGLLINLAIVRDAAAGRRLDYRFVDGGRVREHEYAVAEATEKVEVDGLSWEALRVSRTNGGNDETILWVARGVPTPVRILQREDGEDGIDLRLVAYEGVH